MVASIPRAFWIILGGIGAILVVFIGVVVWGLSPENLKVRLVAEVERATGRTLTMSGRARIAFSLAPTVTLEDVALSNPPGFSRPEMVKIGRVELTLALGPLLQHRIEIERLALVRPDIQLEIDQTGRRNWDFARPAPASPIGSASPPDAGTGGEGFALSLLESLATDTSLVWADQTTGRRIALVFPRLTLAAPPDGHLQLAGTTTYEGRAIGINGRAGPREGKLGWPTALSIESGGATLSATGRVTNPREKSGYRFVIDVNLPEPAVFAPFFPRWPVALMTNITARAEVSDEGGEGPAVPKFELKVKSADLSVIAHGIRLEDVTVTGVEKSPLRVASRVMLSGVESGLRGTVGDLGWLASGASAPVAIDFDWNGASARAKVSGTIQDPVRLTGVALDVSGAVPNPALVTEAAPPALRSVAFQAKFTDGAGPTSFRVTSNAGDLSGELTVSRQPRFSVSGRVVSERLDLDMLRLPPASGGGAGLSAVAGTEEPVAGDKASPMIPDTKLPFDLIRAMDADVSANLAQIRLGGADFSQVSAALSMKDGSLRLDPMTMNAGGQPATASLTADASATPPAIRLKIQAPGLPVGVLLTAAGLPKVANGTLALRADLSGAGETTRALAASLDGWAGMAIEGGQLDAKMVNAWLAQLRPLRIEGGDVTDLRCLAARADAKAGVVTIDPMALNTAALIVEGSGDVDLGHETLALRVRPRTKIGGTGIAVPVRVSGPLGAPSARLDISPGSGGGGALAGLLLGGKDIMGVAGGGDPCPSALARAREGAPGAKP